MSSLIFQAIDWLVTDYEEFNEDEEDSMSYIHMNQNYIGFIFIEFNIRRKGPFTKPALIVSSNSVC